MCAKNSASGDDGGVGTNNYVTYIPTMSHLI